METKFATQSMTYTSGRVIGHSSQTRVSKLLQFFPENLQNTQKKDKQNEIIRGKFYQKQLIKVI